MGNPGSSYASTRHNAGFLVLDRVAERFGCRFRRPFLKQYFTAQTTDRRLYLAKPLTFMNRSGEVLSELFGRSGCSVGELLVVCDNLDLPVGVCRLKNGGSSAGHNGLASMIQHAGSEGFKRLYVGIGRPARGSIIDYVLGTPPPEELDELLSAVERAADAVVALLDRPVDQVMNELNQRKADTP